MRLVDGKQTERQLRQPVHELVLQQAFRGDIDDFISPRRMAEKFWIISSRLRAELM